jgi:uncharacterized membrane protein YgcG
MRKYDDNDERTIRVERLVREWTRSGLIDQAQHDRIAPELKVPFRRTNLFLRLILFGFGIVIIAAAVMLVAVTLGLRRETELAPLCLVAAAACFGLAELLVNAGSLYRFGIEEAAAVSSIVLLALAGAGFTWSVPHEGPGEFPLFVALIIGSIGAFAIYFRFGYVYGAIASMACISLAPFQTGLSDVMQRVFAVGILACAFFAARSKRRKYGDEFPGSEYGIIQAIAWAGIYALLNLHLPLDPLPSASAFPPPFFWFTYAMTWVLPMIGFYLAVRDKDRPLLDVSIVLAIVTLITNKPYLGMSRESWDPIIFGVALIATAILLRKWLSSGERNGFTAERLLSSDKRRLSIVATASTALHTAAHAPVDSASPDKFQSGGGRSGGAGASGEF